MNKFKELIRMVVVMSSIAVLSLYASVLIVTSIQTKVAEEQREYDSFLVCMNNLLYQGVDRRDIAQGENGTCIVADEAYYKHLQK